MFGIKECPGNPIRAAYLEQDHLQNISNAFTEVELPIETSTIKDCF